MSEDIERDLCQKLVKALQTKNATLSLAESCTGGRISSQLTKISGVSSIFLGSVVSYSNASKQKILNVSENSLVSHGAVSEVVAREMCEGLQLAFPSDYQASVTGVAGPTGGTTAKPVGMVCFGFKGPNFSAVTTQKFGEHLSREEIQKKASEFLLSELIKRVQG